MPANEAAKKQFARTLPQLCDYSLTEKIRRVHSPQRGEKRAAQTSTLPPTQRHIIFLAHDVTRNFLNKQPDAVCELRVIVYNSTRGLTSLSRMVVFMIYFLSSSMGGDRAGRFFYFFEQKRERGTNHAD
jgi:hypothetical protein